MTKPYKVTITKAEALASMKATEDLLQEYRVRLHYQEKRCAQLDKRLEDLNIQVRELEEMPIPMLLWCPLCHFRHIDRGEFATEVRAHHSHACQNPKCGLVWRPAKVNTVGVQHLPGYKDPE